MGKGRYVKKIVFIFCMVAFVSMTTYPVCALYWTNLPPYNVLWPLWSPPLVTDFNWDPLVLLGTTPIITELTRNTILPVQPGLAWDPSWDPCQPTPYVIYNAPLGYDMNGAGGYIGYYYPYYGYSGISHEYISRGKYTGGLLYFNSETNSIHPWPPPYLLDPITGAPEPINLPGNYATLLPTDPLWLEVLLTNADQAYLDNFEYLPTSIYSVSPDKCLNAESIPVTIEGENFVQGSKPILQYRGFGGLGYIVDSRATPGTAWDVFLSGNYAFMACGEEGLQVISKDSENLSIIGSCDTPGFAQGIFVSGEYAFIADGLSGLQVISLNGLTEPAIAGFYDTPANYATDVYVRGSFAFVSFGSSGLQVIDISDPAYPAFVGSYYTSNSDARGVHVKDEYAYMADGLSGLHVIDISDPTGPFIVGSCNTPGFAYDVYVGGSYAYMADGDSGLQVINITNPANMTIVGSCGTPDEAFSVTAIEYAYVACKESGMQIINITDPEDPFSESIWDTPGMTYGVRIEGKYAYVADSDSLRVIQLPMLLENINIQDSTTITATVPAGYRPGAYDLQVLSPGGGSSVLKNAFTVSGESYFKEDVKQFGTENNDRSTGIAFDPQKKHLYVVGTIDRDSSSNNLYDDILLAKFGIDGRQKWVREIGSGAASAGNDHGESVLVDPTGNVFVIGYTIGTENQDVLISKRSPSNGSEIWTKYYQTSTSSFDYAMDAVLVPDGTATSIIAVGHTTNAPNGGGQDCFAMKVNSETGDLVYTFGNQGIALSGTSGKDYIEAVVADGPSLYMVGRTKDPSGEDDAYYDAYILKIDTQSGNTLPFATEIFGAEGYFDTFTDICAKDGWLYCIGWTTGQLIDDPEINVGVADPISVKFSPSGTAEEIMQFPYYAHNYGRGILDIGLDGSLSRIMFLGDTQWPLPGSDPTGGYEAFISQFDPDFGLTTWDHSFGTDSYDVAIAAVYASGAIYVVGHTTGAFTSSSQNSAGGTDIYLTKILIPGDNTNQGQDVVVQVSPEIKLTFEQIITSGFTKWFQVSYPPFPYTTPGGFELLSDLFIAETSATFSGAITLDIVYNRIDETPLITISQDDEQLLRLMHYQTQSEGRWVNITTDLDPVNNFISGKTHQLGHFGLMVVRSPVEALNWLIGIIESMNLKQGIENSLDVKLKNAQNALNSLNAGQRQDALNKLDAFRNETEAQRGNQLTTEQTDIIINNLEPIYAFIEAQQ